jgi:hypothetical protein
LQQHISHLFHHENLLTSSDICLNLLKIKNLVINDYGVSTNDVVCFSCKITIPFITNFEQIKKEIVTLNHNTPLLTADENEKIPFAIKDKNFLLEIEDLFKNKVEKYDKALNQVIPEFRCSIDNYNI